MHARRPAVVSEEERSSWNRGLVLFASFGLSLLRLRCDVKARYWPGSELAPGVRVRESGTGRQAESEKVLGMFKRIRRINAARVVQARLGLCRE
jgi:hypothetical protein